MVQSLILKGSQAGSFKVLSEDLQSSVIVEVFRQISK